MPPLRVPPLLCLLIFALAAQPSASSGSSLGPSPQEVSFPPGASPVHKRRVFVSNTTAFPEGPVRSGFQFPRFDARLHDGDEIQLQSIHDTWMSVTHEPLYTLRGRTVALRAASGRFCTVSVKDADSTVRCDQGSPPFSAWFEVGGLGGKVTLREMRKHRFCADDGKHGLRCTRTSASKWEVFGVVDLSGGNIALRSGRSGKYCADSGHGIFCDRDSPDWASTFFPLTDTPLTPRVLHTSDKNAATTFVVERDMSSNWIALKCKRFDGYLMADPDTSTLSCSQPGSRRSRSHDSDSGGSVGSKHLLATRVSWWDSKTATFRAPESRLYLQAGDPDSPDREVKATNKEGSGWALWHVFLLAGFETLRPLVRGVNLGNWLLLERWMAHELFRDASGAADFIGDCSPVDEYGLMHALDRDIAKRRMEKHWSTWITEADISWLAAHGINAVRIPFGYWVVDPSPPFLPGQLKHLDDLFDWCERHSLAVLLDFHGLKGSQTGNPTSGNCGGCGRKRCGKTTIDFLEEDTANLEVIRKLAARYSKSPAYLGFEIANEVSSSVDSLATMKFYKRAYDIIRAHKEDALVVIFATFNPSTYPFPDFQSVVEDVHIYFGMGFGHPTLDQQVNKRHASKAVSGLLWPVLVGEWSLGANGQHTSSMSGADRGEFFADFARMQLQVWETHTTGWFYWSYKTAYANSTWNFRDMCEGGWLPGCHPNLLYASTEWWRERSCAFAYLDGRCQSAPVNIGAVSTVSLLLLAVGGLAAALAAVSFLKPDLAAGLRARASSSLAAAASAAAAAWASLRAAASAAAERTAAAARTAYASVRTWLERLRSGGSRTPGSGGTGMASEKVGLTAGSYTPAGQGPPSPGRPNM